MVHPRTIHGQSIGQNALDFWTFFGRFHGQSIGQSTDGLKMAIKKSLPARNEQRGPLPYRDADAVLLFLVDEILTVKDSVRLFKDVLWRP